MAYNEQKPASFNYEDKIEKEMNQNVVRNRLLQKFFTLEKIIVIIVLFVILLFSCWLCCAIIRRVYVKFRRLRRMQTSTAANSIITSGSSRKSAIHRCWRNLCYGSPDIDEDSFYDDYDGHVQLKGIDTYTNRRAKTPIKDQRRQSSVVENPFQDAFIDHLANAPSPMPVPSPISVSKKTSRSSWDSSPPIMIKVPRKWSNQKRMMKYVPSRPLLIDNAHSCATVSEDDLENQEVAMIMENGSTSNVKAAVDDSTLEVSKAEVHVDASIPSTLQINQYEHEYDRDQTPRPSYFTQLSPTSTTTKISTSTEYTDMSCSDAKLTHAFIHKYSNDDERSTSAPITHKASNL